MLGLFICFGIFPIAMFIFIAVVIAIKYVAMYKNNAKSTNNQEDETESSETEYSGQNERTVYEDSCKLGAEFNQPKNYANSYNYDDKVDSNKDKQELISAKSGKIVCGNCGTKFKDSLPCCPKCGMFKKN